MNKLIAYLKSNCKHLSVAAIMAIYNILVSSGVVPANYQLVINSILAALGISLTTNSGTGDAIKNTVKILIVSIMLLSFTGCATLFGGPITDCQRTKPSTGKPARQVRVWACIPLFNWGPVGVAIDFATGAIYKPCGNGQR